MRGRRWPIALVLRLLVLVEAGLASGLAGCTADGLLAGYYALPEADRLQYHEARAAAEAGDHARAVEIFKYLAERGYPQGLYQLGRAYDDGRGVPESPEVAAALFEQAIEVDSSVKAYALFALGRLYRDGRGVPQDQAHARNLFQKAVTRQNADAAFALGRMLETGQGGPTNTGRAATLYRRALSGGVWPAGLRLTAMLRSGDGIGRDQQEAREIVQRTVSGLEREANAGDAFAAARLWRLYRDGGPIDPDARLAAEWLRRAAEAGHRSARVAYGKHLLFESKRSADHRQGLALLQTAAGAGDGVGDANASSLLGKAFWTGSGVTRDYETAILWYRQAAAAGDSGSALHLGRIYRDGTHITQDLTEARRWLVAAVEHGHASAPRELGLFLLDHGTTSADRAEGVDHLITAAAAGDPAAQLRLAEPDLADALKSAGLDRDALVRQAAASGEPFALFAAADAVLDRRVAGTTAEARRWLRDAANAGHDPARIRLAEMLWTGTGGARDPQAALVLARASAEAGYPYGMQILGDFLSKGLDGKRQPEAAAHWYEKAAAAGQTGAAYALAALRLNGNGSPQQKRAAARLLQGAAEQGHVGAMVLLAQSLIDGAVGRRDGKAALTWLARAADAGHDGARAALGRLKLAGEIGSRDPLTAERLLTQAARNGHVGAMVTLGRALLYGDQGLARDASAGLGWLRQAHQSGHGSAGTTLAQAYLDGIGVPPNPEIAERYLRASVKRGSVFAMSLLGRLLLETYGDDPNRFRQGVDWLARAARKGHDGAFVGLVKAYLHLQGADMDEAETLLWIDEIVGAATEERIQAIVVAINELLSGDVKHASP